MPPTTRSSSSLFNRDPAWSDDSDSSLTDFEDSEEETEQPVHPPLPSRPQPSLPKPQQPQPEQAPSKPVRNTRKTTQKATEERKSSLSKDEGPLPPYNQSGPTVDQIHSTPQHDPIVSHANLLYAQNGLRQVSFCSNLIINEVCFPFFLIEQYWTLSAQMWSGTK